MAIPFDFRTLQLTGHDWILSNGRRTGKYGQVPDLSQERYPSVCLLLHYLAFSLARVSV
jgi:hypothetical protein